MKDLTWDAILAVRDTIIGKDIEYESYVEIYRGPIKTFLLDAKHAVFVFGWLAYRSSGSELRWYKHHQKDPRSSKDFMLVLERSDSRIEDCENGRIALFPPQNYYVVRYFILMKEGNLNQDEVSDIVQ